MTDLVAIAQMRRQVLCAEVESLDRFIGTAKWLLRSRGDGNGPRAADMAEASGRTAATAPKPVAVVSDPGRSDPTRDSPRAGTQEATLSGEWALDTFQFEAVATAS
jgi:hypothetical protein